MKRLWRRFLCFTGDHEWTSKAEQGIKPTEQDIKDGVQGFYRYAAMYCKHCGKGSDLNFQ